MRIVELYDETLNQMKHIGHSATLKENNTFLNKSLRYSMSGNVSFLPSDKSSFDNRLSYFSIRAEESISSPYLFEFDRVLPYDPFFTHPHCFSYIYRYHQPGGVSINSASVHKTIGWLCNNVNIDISIKQQINELPNRVLFDNDELSIDSWENTKGNKYCFLAITNLSSDAHSLFLLSRHNDFTSKKNASIKAIQSINAYSKTTYNIDTVDFNHIDINYSENSSIQYTVLDDSNFLEWVRKFRWGCND